jgi:DNA-binding beta-propeller fold protein YncE
MMRTTPTLLTASFLGACAAAGHGGAEVHREPESGDIVTIIGTGEQASDRNVVDSSGAPIPVAAKRAHFDSPLDTAFDAEGTLFVIDWNGHKLRKLAADGQVYPVAGTGFEGDGCEVTVDDEGCPPLESRLNHPADLMFGPDGSLVIAAWHNSKIKVLAPDGALHDLCGSGARDYLGDGGACFGEDGTELVAFDLPSSVAFDQEGNLFVADQANQVIRRLTPGGATVTTVCGSCPKGGFGCPEGIGYSGDGGPATLAKLNNSYGQSVLPAGKIALDAEQNLYIADTFNHVVRRVSPGSDGSLGEGDPDEETIETIVGTGAPGFSGDGGPAHDAALNLPTDIAVASDGTLYVADRGNHCIRRVDVDGTVSTAAGTCGVNGFSGDGGPATSAELDSPFGVSIAPDGGLVIADTSNHRIRKVLP